MGDVDNVGGLGRIGPGVPDNSKIGAKKVQSSSLPQTSAVQGTTPPATHVDIKGVRAAELAAVIEAAKFPAPVAASGAGTVASKAIGTVDPKKEIARHVLREIRRRDSGEALRSGVGNTR